VFDVTSAAVQFAPGKPLHAYAGKEISRALALGSTDAKDIGSAVTHDLGEDAAQRLAEALDQYKAQYDEVGQVRLLACALLAGWRHVLYHWQSLFACAGR
jgi:membrane-associated progesterone receptor component